MEINRILQRLHYKFVFRRRVYKLAEVLHKVLPKNVRALDIGCGDGAISQMVMNMDGNIDYTGIDILARPTCAIPFKKYDGIKIPYAKNTFDIVQFVDVLHHTNKIKELVTSALEVSNSYLLIKDHEYKNRFDFIVLKFMDWVGNAPHGVNLDYNFKTKVYWSKLFEELDMEVLHYTNQLELYPGIFNWIFGRNLHFITLLKKRSNHYEQ